MMMWGGRTPLTHVLAFILGRDERQSVCMYVCFRRGVDKQGPRRVRRQVL